MMEKLNRIVERLDGNEDKISRHDSRIHELERFRYGTEEQIKNLIKQIADLISIIKWFLGVSITTLIGFFIWYIQTL